MFNRNEISDSHAAPKRVYYHWSELEEHLPDGGMWSIPRVRDRAVFIRASRDLMAKPKVFTDSMRRVLEEWPKSVSVALQTPGLNRRAWIGHAGCFLATDSPEETTRLGWHELNDGQQLAANQAADLVIEEWEEKAFQQQLALWKM